MYESNDLVILSQDLEQLLKLDLGSEYKNELFKGHINAARENLARAGELVGRQDLRVYWNIRSYNKMVTVFVLLGICVSVLLFFLRT